MTIGIPISPLMPLIDTMFSYAFPLIGGALSVCGIYGAYQLTTVLLDDTFQICLSSTAPIKDLSKRLSKKITLLPIMEYGQYWDNDEDVGDDYFDYSGASYGGLRAYGHAYNKAQVVAMMHMARQDGLDPFADPGVGGPFPVTVWYRENESSSRKSRRTRAAPAKRAARKAPTKAKSPARRKTTPKRSPRTCTC